MMIWGSQMKSLDSQNLGSQGRNCSSWEMGGFKAETTHFPHMALMVGFYKAENAHYCNGQILKDRNRPIPRISLFL